MTSSLPLDQIHKGAPATITAVKATNRALSLRLAALGLVIGSRITVVHTLPAGGPLLVRVFESTITLRRAEASQILVRPGAGELSSTPLPLISRHAA